MYHGLFIDSSIEGILISASSFLVIVNKAFINIHVQAFCVNMLSFLFSFTEILIAYI